MGKNYIQLSKEQAQAHPLYGIKGWFLVFVWYLVISVLIAFVMVLKMPDLLSTFSGQLVTIGMNICLLIILHFKPVYFRNTVLTIFLLDVLFRLALMVLIIQSPYVSISLIHLLTSLIPVLWAIYIYRSKRVLVTTRHMILDDMTTNNNARKVSKIRFNWHQLLVIITVLSTISALLFSIKDFDSWRKDLGFSNQEEEYKRLKIQNYYANKQLEETLNRPAVGSLDAHLDAIIDAALERSRSKTYIDEINYDYDVAKIYLSNEYQIRQDIIVIAKTTSNIEFNQKDSQEKVVDWFLKNFGDLIISGKYPEKLKDKNPISIQEFHRLEVLYCILGKYNNCTFYKPI